MINILIFEQFQGEWGFIGVFYPEKWLSILHWGHAEFLYGHITVTLALSPALSGRVLSASVLSASQEEFSEAICSGKSIFYYKEFIPAWTDCCRIG